ncbi:PhzF family phenazine biosynthesis protein [Aspergillus ibericus CBS 121593]|uniref:Phenazine biosynthesis-like protein n=1 Tax=Aspergillus ibericus CBS 121593 TaxID=1448316 RepID=A0A395GVL1_9EURO|nr:phenazine biosynthesis-like protein [Aspergillus ibericus CBS 121593]RAK98727.1 phenazine biosynthesis-like protein [Aspergillus ibericus CBS 121593]
MSAPQASYVTLDVFSEQRFRGNPVAIVKRIAREFNFPETVFLHAGGKTPRVDIFTPVNEMEFAGHPIIGTGHLLFQESAASSQTSNLTVLTKAGPVPLAYNRARRLVHATVPHNIHIHQQEATLDQIRAVQRGLNPAADLNNVKDTHPVVSMVKGVTYALVDLTERQELFAALVPGESPKLNLDEGWSPSFTGVMYYHLLNTRAERDSDVMVWDLRVRMIAINLEDPACGSGGCALSAYLALSRGDESRVYRFNIDQGEEMGRDSRIIVDICLDEEGRRVSEVRLAGQATVVAEGKIYLD